MPQGTVKSFDQEKGYGFIVPDRPGPDVFVHYSDISGTGFRKLTKKQRVEFHLTEREQGQQAKQVRVLPGMRSGSATHHARGRRQQP